MFLNNIPNISTVTTVYSIFGGNFCCCFFKRQSNRERDTVHCCVTPQMVTTVLARPGQAEAWGQELHLGLPHGQGSKHLGRLLLLSQAH